MLWWIAIIAVAVIALFAWAFWYTKDMSDEPELTDPERETAYLRNPGGDYAFDKPTKPPGGWPLV